MQKIQRRWLCHPRILKPLHKRIPPWSIPLNFGKLLALTPNPRVVSSTCRVPLELKKLSRSATLHPAPFGNIPMSNRYWKSNNFRLESQWRHLFLVAANWLSWFVCSSLCNLQLVCSCHLSFSPILMVLPNMNGLVQLILHPLDLRQIFSLLFFYQNSYCKNLFWMAVHLCWV